jgi:hypothetical protein
MTLEPAAHLVDDPDDPGGWIRPGSTDIPAADVAERIAIESGQRIARANLG